MKVTPNRLITVAASAGGVEALSAFVSTLDPDIDAAVLVMLHVAPGGGGALPRILDRAGRLPTVHAQDGEALTPGRVFVAPPDRHLLVHEGRLRLSAGPQQKGHRPAADPLFRSAALEYGPRVIALVLSGTLDDGSAGARQVERGGGTVGAQDPDEAAYPAMPRATIEAVNNPHVLPVRELAQLANRLAKEPPERVEPPPPDLESVQDIRLLLTTTRAPSDEELEPSSFICPECGGPLYTARGNHQYRCQVGHLWSPYGLMERQGQVLENALWAALRALHERAELNRRLAAPATRRRHLASATHFTEAAEQAEQAEQSLRQLLEHQVLGLARLRLTGPPPANQPGSG